MEHKSINPRKEITKNYIEGKALKTAEEKVLQSTWYNCLSSEYVKEVSKLSNLTGPLWK